MIREDTFYADTLGTVFHEASYPAMDFTIYSMVIEFREML